MTPELQACQICAASTVEEFADFPTLLRVTSDCRPWPVGGRLGLCASCGAVQKVADEEWRHDIAKIYADYALYPQGRGAEQAVFDGSSGNGTSRSDRLVTHLLPYIQPETRGRILDIGCGNGAFLVAFGHCRGGWDLYGSELDERNRARLSTIPQFRELFTNGLSEIGESFDCISLIHALEHFENPGDLLDQIRECLSGTDASAIIQVPDWRVNPFDLLIADHLHHFSGETLGVLLRRSGFEVIRLAQDWVPKEISVVARCRNSGIVETGALGPDIAAIGADIGRCLRWLQEVSNEARALAVDGPIGIFGSSIAASWLHGVIGESAAFFVDEDVNRQGGHHLGRPILAPVDVPDGSAVYVPLAPASAKGIIERLGAIGGPCYVAPRVGV